MRLSASTTLAAVVGSPVRHSRSPAMHNAAFAALGLDWAYVAFEVGAGRGSAAVAAMRALGLGGLSITMPCKAEAAAAVDELSEDAAVLGAVNCVAWAGDRLVGLNTDGVGFLRALAEDPGLEPGGAACVVIGAGGAARAVVRALALAGAADIAVANRTAGRADAAAGLAGPAGRALAPGELSAAVASADLVVNATPIGMAGDRGLPVAVEALSSRQVVVDLVYEPRVTPLVEAAAERGAVAVNGLGMLVHQAAEAFRAWTGHDPPVEAMRRAATSG